MTFFLITRFRRTGNWQLATSWERSLPRSQEPISTTLSVCPHKVSCYPQSLKVQSKLHFHQEFRNGTIMVRRLCDEASPIKLCNRLKAICLKRMAEASHRLRFEPPSWLRRFKRVLDLKKLTLLCCKLHETFLVVVV